MRALVCNSFEGKSGLGLGDLADPGAPGADEVRIRVLASGVNFADLLIVEGKYQVRPALPFAPGFEVCGHVEAVGKNVDRFKPGERVMALVDHGGHAEVVIAASHSVFAVPDGMSDIEAAGFPIAYGTSYLGLTEKAQLRPGETLLVHGAAGGVGLTAVEIGKALGAVVIATAGGTEKCDLALAHGADHAIDYRRYEIKEKVKELVGGVDVVYDPVGGAVFDASLRVVNWDARLVIVGFAAGQIEMIPANILLVKNVSALGFYFGSYRKHRPELVGRAFAALSGLWKKGALRPLVSHAMALEDFGLAFDLLRSRRAAGKVVLRP